MVDGVPPQDLLLLQSVEPRVTTLGPSPCACVWVQGCRLACRGCMSRHTWDPEAGRRVRVVDVAAWLQSLDVRRLTVSGGEPFDQAEPLRRLVDLLREDDPEWQVTMYSGYRLEVLQADVRPGAAGLLDRIDLLIDGRYRVDEHDGGLLWRGSSNQRLHRLSDRIQLPADEAVGTEALVDADGRFRVVGVWPQAGGAAEFIHRLTRRDGFEPDDLPPLPIPTLED